MAGTEASLRREDLSKDNNEDLSLMLPGGKSIPLSGNRQCKDPGREMSGVNKEGIRNGGWQEGTDRGREGG